MDEMQTNNRDEFCYEEYESEELSTPFITTEPNQVCWRATRPNIAKSLRKCAILNLQISTCGFVFGLMAIGIWWIDLHINTCCYSKSTDSWNLLQLKFKRLCVMSMSFKEVVVQLWPLACIIPVLGWRISIRQNIFVWNLLRAFFMVSVLQSSYIYDVFQYRLRSYLGNVFFVVGIGFCHWKLATYYLGNHQSFWKKAKLAAKASMQLSVGIAWWIFVAYFILPSFERSSSLVKAVLSTTIPIASALPKLLTGFVIGRLEGAYSPGEAVNFIMALQVCTTLAARLFQADSSSFVVFLAISSAHAFLGITDKLLLPVRDKISRMIAKQESMQVVDSSTTMQHCGSVTSQPYELRLDEHTVREGQKLDRPPRVTRLIADQSLVSMMTETSAIIVSCAVVPVIKDLYSTKDRNHDGVLFLELFKRVGAAIMIEYIANIFAIHIQTYMHNIPVIKVWRFRWRWILLLHLIQVIYSMVYFPVHINAILLEANAAYKNNSCRQL
ncbi:uncharacterized protein LOC135684598 [Rhopilema esculentum]|uniref:uncharacterized protein LOC135684598 n=1 Tax=Rhopilema esculentum TaxID=499914 RepID=UPI0031D98555